MSLLVDWYDNWFFPFIWKSLFYPNHTKQPMYLFYTTLPYRSIIWEPSIKWTTFHHTKIFFNNNTETVNTSFGTYFCLLLNIIACDIKGTYRTLAPVCVNPLYTMWPPGYSTSILQVFIICEAFTNEVLHFWKQEKVRHLVRMCEGCSKMS